MRRLARECGGGGIRAAAALEQGSGARALLKGTWALGTAACRNLQSSCALRLVIYWRLASTLVLAWPWLVRVVKGRREPEWELRWSARSG